MTHRKEAASVLMADRRATQRDLLVDAAERRIADGGGENLRARDLAQDIGVALGAIYNLVSDLAELKFLVASRTLRRLDEALTAAADEAASGQDGPCDELIAIAIAYFGFARSNSWLWRGIFDLRSNGNQDLPEWMSKERSHMFRHILRPLQSLMPETDQQSRQLFAHTLFTATHGVVQLGLEQRLFAVPASEIEGQLALLVRAVCKGLEDRP